MTKAKPSLKDIDYTVATGDGAANVSFSHGVASDISCLARGVYSIGMVTTIGHILALFCGKIR